MILLPTSETSAYKVAMWTGFFYMWSLLVGGIFMKDKRPDEGLGSYIVIAGLFVVPLVLTTIFSYRFGTEYRYAYIITGIPAVLAVLLQYFLLSYIPVMFVPRGVMVHILGPAHPFDLFGQILAALPIVGWAVIFPILGHLISEMIQSLQRRFRVSRRSETRED